MMKILFIFNYLIGTGEGLNDMVYPFDIVGDAPDWGFYSVMYVIFAFAGCINTIICKYIVKK